MTLLLVRAKRIERWRLLYTHAPRQLALPVLLAAGLYYHRKRLTVDHKVYLLLLDGSDVEDEESAVAGDLSSRMRTQM